MLVWRMDLDTAELYFKLCMFLEPKTEEERVAILAMLIDCMESVSHTNRTPEQLAKDLSKHGNVLHVKPTENKDGVHPGGSGSV